jgi:hypothetical protein
MCGVGYASVQVTRYACDCLSSGFLCPKRVCRMDSQQGTSESGAHRSPLPVALAPA